MLKNGYNFLKIQGIDMLSFPTIYKNTLIVIAGMLLGLIIAVSYDISDGGIMFAGEYKTCYWADIIQYLQSLF